MASKQKAKKRDEVSAPSEAVLVADPANTGRFQLVCCGNRVYKIDTQTGVVWNRTVDSGRNP